MPIRLNLLAEAQALEDLRRRDPMKRVLWIAGLLLVLMLAWASSLQLRALLAKSDLHRVEAAMSTKDIAYKQVIENSRRIADSNAKLTALAALSSNRFLNGTLLNALQQTTVEDVQLARLKVEQSYVLVEETKARTNGSKVLPGTPATVTEKITLSLDGTDTSASPGDQVPKFKEALAANPYIRGQLSAANQINSKYLSSPTPAPDTGRAKVNFTLEWHYPEQTR